VLRVLGLREALAVGCSCTLTSLRACGAVHTIRHVVATSEAHAARARAVPGMDQAKMDAIFSELAEPTPAYTAQQMQQLSTVQNEYEKRDEAVAELIKEVTAIQEVMRDLSVLVVEQGSMVDRIDQNIVAAAQNIERGAEQVARAHEASKSGTMATCIFVLLIAIAITFVLMLIVKR
jgi:SNARE domain